MACRLGGHASDAISVR